MYFISVIIFFSMCGAFFFQRNCRYDGQIAVFGQAYQEALAKHKFFIVGAGMNCFFKKFQCLIIIAKQVLEVFGFIFVAFMHFLIFHKKYIASRSCPTNCWLRHFVSDGLSGMKGKESTYSRSRHSLS